MSNDLGETNVDIIMPNYNSAPYLLETIESVVSQTFKSWKLIIVDGNSNFETKKILKSFIKHPKINIIFLKKNKRPGFCRNLGMRKSKSEYIAFIDSDDVWEKEKLSKQLNFMNKNKYYFTYTNYFSFLSGKEGKNLREIIPAKYFNFDAFIKDTSIGTSTMIVKRSELGNVKFSNTKICEDYFFKCQILKKVNYAHCLAESLTKYRIRKDSLQSKKLRNFYWIWYINKNHNQLGLIKNLLSLLCISINSLKKYGFN